MNFFAVLLALVCEQLKPLPHGNPVHQGMIAWVRWTGRNFDAGRSHHAAVVWTITVVGPALLVGAIYALVRPYSLLLSLALDVLVLYLTLGFRQFSHYFTDIRDALERGDELEARRLLAEWRHLDASELPRTELLRHVLEHSLLAAHRHVFGVFFWFVLLSTLGLGPAGAVLYRMAEFAGRYWAFKSRTLDAPTNERLMVLSRKLFGLIDHIPARLTATGFAIVGNFEEAVNAWRRDAALWAHSNEGVILAAAAGAVGVQLGGSAAPGVTPDRSKTFESGGDMDATRAEGSTSGAPPQLGHLQSVVGLVWRSVVLWMMLLALLTLANLVG
ncbi:CobD/CbiB family protein [Roseateles chitosanitabidus]|jgi:adenosylcobinamide-phosphate synthase|uniref:CobD/CbiB family protein n=1 Tax=Roseateles chitosanitabidus TaxID=65048 RepID=UPI0008305920|nr:CobD/CbiB family protein [Roseateles chitosanitabidus]MBO9686354.1 CobD/CbiB family protein [Roseateles chitosanitabidus]